MSDSPVKLTRITTEHYKVRWGVAGSINGTFATEVLTRHITLEGAMRELRRREKESFYPRFVKLRLVRLVRPMRPGSEGHTHLTGSDWELYDALCPYV